MTNRHWLKREVPAWVKEKLISEEEGKALLARYRKGKPGPYKEAFFVMALVCLLGGLGFLGAGLWNGLTQDERFLLALVPLLVSLLFVVTVVLLDRRIPDDPVAVKGVAMPEARHRSSQITFAGSLRVRPCGTPCTISITCTARIIAFIACRL